MRVVRLLRKNLDLQIVLVATLFFFSACLGHFLTFNNLHTLAVWPPTGIALACLLILGRRVWPGIMIGALLANLLAFWNTGSASLTHVIILSASVATANTLETLLGNLLVRRWIHTIFPFKNAKNAFRFLAVALMMSLAGSALTTTSFYLVGIVTVDQILQSVLFNCIGDLVGVLLFTPVLLSLSRPVTMKFNNARFVEMVAFVVLIAMMFLFLRNEYFYATFERAIPFIILPALLWMSFKYDLVIAAVVVMIVSLVSTYFTIHKTGPFILSLPDHSILLLQIFVAVMSSSTLVVSATVKERELAQKQLLDFNETLEEKITQRTRALNEEIETRKIAEQKLVQTNNELSKRNTELDNFVYSVSHDLRAPIASVLGLINLARKDEGLMKDQYLDLIQKSAQQQDHFIKEILDQSRNSRLEIRREEISFENLINDTFNQLKFATSTGQHVERIINVQQDKAFYCDSWRLKVMLNNIISNSIRYRNGKDPVIQVDVNVNNACAQVEIQDNGKGIPKEHLANVCKMFYRATDDGAGSGLGLYIVKETIDKLKGGLKIDSEVGKGTRVSLTIPEVILPEMVVS